MKRSPKAGTKPPTSNRAGFIRPGLSLLFPPALLLGVLLACFLLARLDFPQNPFATTGSRGPDGAEARYRSLLQVDDRFPADPLVLAQAAFWVRAYLDWSEKEGVFHDPENPALIVRKISDPFPYTPESRARIAAEAQKLQRDIAALLARSGRPLTPAERELRAAFPAHWNERRIAEAAKRIRFQRGLRESFRAGVARSRLYLPHIDSVLRREGLPYRLRYLPHVESSFEPRAYSRLGAAGLWQLMPAAAKGSLRMDETVDERRDPKASTLAAALHLKAGHRSLRSWPLAILAYNHGTAGVKKALKREGADDFFALNARHRSASFGFASRNFYAEFLAASSLAMKADSLFPDLPPASFPFTVSSAGPRR